MVIITKDYTTDHINRLAKPSREAYFFNRLEDEKLENNVDCFTVPAASYLNMIQAETS